MNKSVESENSSNFMKGDKLFIVSNVDKPNVQNPMFCNSAKQAAVDWATANVDADYIAKTNINLIARVSSITGSGYVGLGVENGSNGKYFKALGASHDDEIHPCFEEIRSQIIHECVGKTATFTFEREHVYPFDDLEEEYLREYLIEGVLPKK